ncbi:hypothetical protein EV207_11659 [Scopulibacillus darangshiensis]|uniref:DinB family protein n=1 Tax=Scopulibacillus darangshiensis TaxID=442528 RepID=A0A4R2P2G3_9BACL|nr:hypothetical protein [Scopulibacillus darangshiensis]TCP28747.1 hypothetical protein EV207_11659 [Scopulibacillus darangshiensis]
MNETLRNSVKTMVKETFEGPPREGGMFTESRPNSGLFGTLDQLTANDASIAVNGTTVAAHADHTRFYLWGTNAILKVGKQPEMDWGGSWKINLVDEKGWNRIREELRHEYLTFLETLDVIEWNEPLTKEVLGSLAHSAYHLGAIRQMLKVIKK